MASPILSQRTYRLSRIPKGATTDEIRELFPPNVKSNIQYFSLARSPSSTNRDSQVATVTFKREPAIFESLPFKFGSLLSVPLGGVSAKFQHIWVDTHFHGFTALNDPFDEQEVVEYVRCLRLDYLLCQDKKKDEMNRANGFYSIVALTGLGGKAFASWQCYDGSMWLRDDLPMTVPNARISLYGYSSEVGVSDSISTLSEMSEAFVMDLVNWRGLRSLHYSGKVRLSDLTFLTSVLRANNKSPNQIH